MKPFDFPNAVHLRRHGPRGYISYQRFKNWLRDEFLFRCVYCLRRELWGYEGHFAFSCDHVIPQVVAPSKVCDYDNLVYACVRCNSLKRDDSVLNPCEVALAQHIEVLTSGEFRPLTADGTSHIRVLKLNDANLVDWRRRWIVVITEYERRIAEGGHGQFSEWMGFPLDLPPLHKLRPPQGNSRPQGVRDCFFLKRQRGELPPSY
jgi:hypothetical protein